jgi:NADH-quinone oxidoreductase subunit J
MQDALFYIFAFLTLVFGFLVVLNPFSRNPVTSAMFLVMTIASLAALFVLLQAFFLAAVQVLVYAGAVMVLFLFVIMLLNLGRPGPTDIKGPVGVLTALVLAGALLLQLKVLGETRLSTAIQLPPGSVAGLQQQQGIVGAVAYPLFGAYLIPFEIASVLLLAAIVGAVVLAKRKL